MEKRKPHHDLGKLKGLFRRARTRVITATARKGAVAMGYMDVEAMQGVIERLSPAHFHKSMTTYRDSRIWQDVYRFRDDDGRRVYIKLQLSFDGKKAVLIQMKRDEGGDE
jgi:motility quorum-sensing regulator / GCU-specific mRNA interferase toxin